MIVFAMIAVVLALPIAGLSFFRLYENELVRQTERELIAQSAALAAVFAVEAERRLTDGLELGNAGAPLVVQTKRYDDPPSGLDSRYQPLLPRLDLARHEIRGARPDPLIDVVEPAMSYFEIGAVLRPIARATQKHTLAGFRILDPSGRIIVGRDDVGRSLAHVEEVALALKGRYASVLRQRVTDAPPPSIYSISRGTRVRVFTAMPVIVQGRVAGVIYASRTPENIVKHLYGERRNVFFAVLAVAAAAVVVGFVFLRTITRPIHELVDRTKAISQGDRDAIRPLARQGTREIARLSESFFAMARSLFDRSDFVATFAAHVSHELKSPLTSIQGAAELLRDSGSAMTEAERRRFLDNVIGDTQRLAVLLQRLRELARADNPPTIGVAPLKRTVTEIRTNFPGIAVDVTGDVERAVAMSPENALIVLSHLVDNAEHHNATAVTLDFGVEGGIVRAVVADDGDGISVQNRERVFDTFFTTRRDSGGTGMGLRIVQSMMTAHGGTIRLLPEVGRTAFELRLPLAGATT